MFILKLIVAFILTVLILRILELTSKLPVHIRVSISIIFVIVIFLFLKRFAGDAVFSDMFSFKFIENIK